MPLTLGLVHPWNAYCVGTIDKYAGLFAKRMLAEDRMLYVLDLVNLLLSWWFSLASCRVSRIGARQVTVHRILAFECGF